MLKALMTGGLAAGLMAGLMAGSIGQANAQPAGAPAAAPMQSGGWGHQGWQPGGDYAPMAAPDGGMPVQPMMQPGAMMPPPGMGPRPDRPMQPHGVYRRIDRGGHLRGPWLDPSYTVQDWRNWGLAPPPPGARWVRYYDDAALIDPRGGVIDTRYGIDWDAPRDHGGPGGWAHGGGYHHGYGPGPAYGPGYGPRPTYGVRTIRTGPNTVVTTQTVPGPMPMIYGGGYDGYGNPGATVIVTPGTITTTTTTTDVTSWGSIRHRRGHRRCACRK